MRARIARKSEKDEEIQRSSNGSIKKYTINVAASAPITGGLRKRGLDIGAALLLIAFLLPLLFLIVIAIKLTSRGPVFSRSSLIGLRGKPFNRLRFCIARDLVADPRLTSFGFILRQTGLEELPQLFSILKADMSFVGPRPIAASEVPEYGLKIVKYVVSRPGLTGPWRTGRSPVMDLEERVRLNAHYADNWSLWRDMVIIFRTVVVSARRPIREDILPLHG